MRTPEEAKARLLELNDAFNKVIQEGMGHQSAQGGVVIMVTEDLCADSAVILAGRNVIDKLVALQQEARDVNAEGVASALLAKLTT